MWRHMVNASLKIRPVNAVCLFRIIFSITALSLAVIALRLAEIVCARILPAEADLRGEKSIAVQAQEIMEEVRQISDEAVHETCFEQMPVCLLCHNQTDFLKLAFGLKLLEGGLICCCLLCTFFYDVLRIHEAGKEIQKNFENQQDTKQNPNQQEKASSAYETLMTEPRKDLGDRISKAFRNVDDILIQLLHGHLKRIFLVAYHLEGSCRRHFADHACHLRVCLH